jgi:hypothetical protein
MTRRNRIFSESGTHLREVDYGSSGDACVEIVPGWEERNKRDGNPCRTFRESFRYVSALNISYMRKTRSSSASRLSVHFVKFEL